jgi:hypothetical protein
MTKQNSHFRLNEKEVQEYAPGSAFEGSGN